MIPKPKIYGFPLPSSVDDGSCVSVTLQFPNILEYRAAFNGQINMLGKWFQWAHTQEDYQETPEFNQLVAQLWVEVLYNAIWSDDCMTFCGRIIECISSNPATRAAIVDALKSDSDFNQYLAYQVYRLTEGQIAGKLVPDDCDDSVVAGRAIALVERLDTNNKDFLEMIETGTNDEERIADIIGAIPGLAETPVNEVIDVFQDFLEDFAENYNSISTEGRKDDMARLIYCLMKETEGCSITFEQLFLFFQEQAESGLTILSTFIDVINFLKDGDFDNDNALWFGMFALQIGFVLNSREFSGVEIGTISGIMRDATPSSRWEDWEPCGPVAERTPVINSVWDDLNFGGSLSGPDEFGVYTATTTLRGSGSGYGFAIMDISGRDFVLTDIVFSNPPQCEVFVLNESPFFIGCPGIDVYAGQTCDEFHVTQTSSTPTTMQFKMVAP